MIRSLFDADVLVSGFPATGGTLSDLIDLWEEDRFELIVSEHILAEVRRAWLKPYWSKRFSFDLAERTLAAIRRVATLTNVNQFVEGVASHPEDDLVLSAALHASVDYVVTGDRGLLAVRNFKGIEIVSPVEFLQLLRTLPDRDKQTTP